MAQRLRNAVCRPRVEKGKLSVSGAALPDRGTDHRPIEDGLNLPQTGFLRMDALTCTKDDEHQN